MYALLEGGSEGGNPARVALKGATEYELLGHDCDGWLLVRIVVGVFAVLGSRSRSSKILKWNFSSAKRVAWCS